LRRERQIHGRSLDRVIGEYGRSTWAERGVWMDVKWLRYREGQFLLWATITKKESFEGPAPRCEKWVVSGGKAQQLVSPFADRCSSRDVS